jgi:sphingosine kinase
MVSTLDVEKLGASVSLSFDGEKLTIQGDKDARKKGIKYIHIKYNILYLLNKTTAKPSQSLFCLPSQPQQQQDPTQFPIPNVNILHAAYNPNTNMVQFSAVIPKEPHQPESEAQLYKFMYTVKQEEKQKAIDFCNTIITHAYKGWNYIYIYI